MSQHSTRSGNRVYRELLSKILDGLLAPGSRLPNEQELAEEFCVARSTLRRALDRLKQDKLVVSRQGDGHYVSGFSRNESHEVRIAVDCTFDNLYEVRKQLDCMAAAQAAMTRPQEQLDNMADAIDATQRELDRPSIDLLNIRRIDIEFHQAIANCSSNVLLRSLIDAHAAALGPDWITWMKLDQDSSRTIASRSNREHNLIFAAIQAGNPAAAESGMRSHFMSSIERAATISSLDPTKAAAVPPEPQ
ncbi:MAG: FCD domain-containing protein [Pseudomonadota bacterium]